MNNKLVVTVFFVSLLAGCMSAQPSGSSVSNKPRKVKNVILMIGDGMGTAQIYAGLTANKGALNLEMFTCMGFSKTNSANSYITESAAGATAIAIGQKTRNGAIGVDSLNRPMPTLLEIAEKNGLATGLVATTDITDATPAAFTAHQPTREMHQEIAADFLKSGVDLFIGAGKEHFTNRKDGQDLVAQLKQKGYQVAYEMDAISKIRSGKVAGFVTEKRATERGNQLSKSAQTALAILKHNPKGFFLMIEGSKIDDGGHGNDLNYVVEEMLDFDKVIGEVLEFAKQDGETLVIVTADHETGGLTLTKGDLKTGVVEGKFSTGDHTGVMVPVFAYGPGAEAFMGIYHNNTIFTKVLNAFQFDTLPERK